MFSSEQYEALRGAAGLVERNRGRLRLTGEDRRTYLQGLLTNDIDALAPGTGCYACLLTAQGRMISDMYVVETGREILIDLERESAQPVLSHFERFIFSEDVQVEDQSAATAGIGVFGPRAASVVEQVLGGAAQGLDAAALDRFNLLENRTLSWDGSPLAVVRRDDVGVPGFELLIESARGEALKESLRNAGAVVVEDAVVDACRIEAGRPVFHKDMDEDTIPLEAGIEDRAISLTKGCYVGQEIIIRVLHRGHGRVARRLVGLTFEPAASTPAPGASVRSGDKEIGRVTSAIWSPALQRPIALGYVHRDFTEPSTVVDVAGEAGSASAQVTRLPFVHPTDSTESAKLANATDATR